MADKGGPYTAPSSSHLMTELKDVMVEAGWELVGPSVDPAAQDDANGFVLGWFLRSSGEDGKQDIYIHLSMTRGFSSSTAAYIAYLTSGITADDTTIPVSNGALYSAGSKIRIDNEIITVGGVSSNNLTGCTRQASNLTPKASHSSGAVVQEVYHTSGTTYAMLLIEVYGYADWSNPIFTSSGGTFTTTGVTAADLSGYGNDDELPDYFSNHSLIQIWDPSGPDHQKMRWVTSYTKASGAFQFQAFKTAPGTKACRIISGGFLGPQNHRWTSGSSGYSKGYGVVNGTNTFNADGYSTYVFANKDRVIVVVPAATHSDVNYGMAYAGTVVHPNPHISTLEVSQSAGNNTIVVDDAKRFCIGALARITANNGVSDWIANRNRSSEPPGGSAWNNLDPEEWPTEQILVSGVDYETNTLTLSQNLIFSYTAGAMIGEAPRNVVTKYPRHDNAYHPGFVYQAGIAYYRNTFISTYRDAPPADWASQASHRGPYRSFHESGDRYTPRPCCVYWETSYQGGSPQWRGDTAITCNMYATGTFQGNESNAASGNMVMSRVTLTKAGGTTVWGNYPGMLGYLRGVWVFPKRGASAPFGGVAVTEDTCEALYRGSWIKLRIFYCDYCWYAIPDPSA